MTLLALFSPLLFAAAIAMTATGAHRRLPPHLAARFVTCALVALLIATLPSLLVITFAFLAHVPLLGPSIEWCTRAIGFHDAIPVWLGAPAALLVVVGTARATRVLRDHRRLRCDRFEPVEVVADATPIAITMPGSGGKIVLSQGLVELLDAAETEVVVAHERAHARHRHDRFLLIATLTAAFLPPLRSLSARLVFSIERWADEAAVRACGDRRLVARTLGKVALRNPYPVGVAGFAGLGVAARVQALLAPPRAQPTRPVIAGLWVAVAAVVGLSSYQIHHLHTLVSALCPH